MQICKPPLRDAQGFCQRRFSHHCTNDRRHRVRHNIQVNADCSAFPSTAYRGIAGAESELNEEVANTQIDPGNSTEQRGIHRVGADDHG